MEMPFYWEIYSRELTKMLDRLNVVPARCWLWLAKDFGNHANSVDGYFSPKPVVSSFQRLLSHDTYPFVSRSALAEVAIGLIFRWRRKAKIVSTVVEGFTSADMIDLNTRVGNSHDEAVHQNEYPLSISKFLAACVVARLATRRLPSAPLDRIYSIVFRGIDNSDLPARKGDVPFGRVIRMNHLWTPVCALIALARTARHSAAARKALAVIFMVSDKLRQRLGNLVLKHGKSHDFTSNEVSGYPAALLYYTLQARAV